MNDQGRAFYDQLRALEKRAEASCRRAGQPYSRRETEQALRAAPYRVELSGQRISDWLSDDPEAAKIPSPASSEKVWALVRLWSRWAGEEPRERHWRTLMDRAQSVRTHRTVSTSPGRPVALFTDPFALEVHKAIEAEPTQAETLPLLPAYIPRAHDARLRAIVTEAVGGASRAVVLVGGSATGKTRACWETLGLLPDNWRLWHPIDPSRPEAALAEMQEIGPRTVVWLNEAQHYLLTPASDVGERVAAGLREVLRDPDGEPVLVLGTIWPEYLATLTAQPDPKDKKKEDPHAQARALLADRVLPVPAAFTDPSDVDALHAAAAADPRLASAAERAAEGHITQYLAGGPALLEHYDTAPAAARALIDVAIDARRLGLGPALPPALLEAAAGGYLTDTQWSLLSDDWFEEALAFAARPVRGARGALTRVRSRHGEASPAHPRYRLADYLEEHGRRARAGLCPPIALWTASADHTPSSEHTELAEMAQRHGLRRISFGLYRDLAADGDTRALDTLVEFLSVMGRTDEALAWYHYAAEAGHTVDVRAIARTLGIVLDGGDEALLWHQLLVSEGDTSVLPDLVRLLARLSRTDEALTWSRRAAEAEALVDPGELAEQATIEGRTEDALVWYRCKAESGDSTALRGVAVMLVRLGRSEEALDVLLQHAQAGDVFAMGEAGWLLAELGRPGDALTWYRRAAEEGDGFAYRCVARMLTRLGRAEEARSWYRRAANEAGDPYALQEVRQLQGLVPHEWKAVWKEQLRVPYGLEGDEAVPWLLATERGTHASPQKPAFPPFPVGYDDLLRVMTGLVREGRNGGTFSVLNWPPDDPNWPDQILRLLREHGLIDRAVAWCQAKAAADPPYGDWYRAAHLLLKVVGRTDEAQHLRRYGWEPDGNVSHPWEALPPETPIRSETLRRHHRASKATRKKPASDEAGEPAWWRP
ncbi:tetratricopeptide repeat protein [Streptomyces cupreus]|uniref:Tetratricopeptide repeat protein n=1 Tax=Streptomyces cupreus TaxID=2759956 RepID=A0A7X1JCC8_9ACTN|nr:tetratricopeptide repeat protein [Streptomyces cupreus]MBC2907700.1 tetratricopeptide repeat protein [Streptomyces cupreus]